MNNIKQIDYSGKRSVTLEEKIQVVLISDTEIAESGIDVSVPFFPYSYELNATYNGTAYSFSGKFDKWYDCTLGTIGDTKILLDNTHIYLDTYISGVIIDSLSIVYHKPLWRDSHNPEFHEIWNTPITIEEGTTYLNFDRLDMFSNQFSITLSIGNDSITYADGDDDYVLGRTGVLANNHNEHTITVGALTDGEPDTESVCNGSDFFSFKLGDNTAKATIEYGLHRLVIVKSGTISCTIESVSQWFADRHFYLEPKTEYILSDDNFSSAYSATNRTPANKAYATDNIIRLAHTNSVAAHYSAEFSRLSATMTIEPRKVTATTYNSLSKQAIDDIMIADYSVVYQSYRKHNGTINHVFNIGGNMSKAFNAHRSNHSITDSFAMYVSNIFSRMKAKCVFLNIECSVADNKSYALKCRTKTVEINEKFAIGSDINVNKYNSLKKATSTVEMFATSNATAVIRVYNYVRYGLNIDFVNDSAVTAHNYPSKSYSLGETYNLASLALSDVIKRRAILGVLKEDFVLGADIITSKYHIWNATSNTSFELDDNITYTTYKPTSIELSTDMQLADIALSVGKNYNGIITDWNLDFIMTASQPSVTIAYNNEQFKAFVNANLANADVDTETRDVMFNTMVKSYTENTDGSYDIVLTGYTNTPRSESDKIYVQRSLTTSNVVSSTTATSITSLYMLYNGDTDNYLTTPDGKYRLAVTRILRSSSSTSNQRTDYTNFVYFIRYDSDSGVREIIPCGNIIFAVIASANRKTISANAWKTGQVQGYASSETPADYDIEFKWGDYDMIVNTADFTGMTAISSSDWAGKFSYYLYKNNVSVYVNGYRYMKYVDSTTDFSHGIYYMRMNIYNEKTSTSSGSTTYNTTASNLPYDVYLSNEKISDYAASETKTVTTTSVTINGTSVSNILQDFDGNIMMTNDGLYYLALSNSIQSSRTSYTTYLVDKTTGDMTESGTYNSATGYFEFNYTDTEDFGFYVSEDYGFTLTCSNITLPDDMKIAENEVITLYGKIIKKGENVYEFE